MTIFMGLFLLAKKVALAMVGAGFAHGGSSSAGDKNDTAALARL
jgi:hypothetical protein